MDENELGRRNVECKTELVRSRGRPMLGWMGEDLRVL